MKLRIFTAALIICLQFILPNPVRGSEVMIVDLVPDGSSAGQNALTILRNEFGLDVEYNTTMINQEFPENVMIYADAYGDEVLDSADAEIIAMRNLFISSGHHIVITGPWRLGALPLQFYVGCGTPAVITWPGEEIFSIDDGSMFDGYVFYCHEDTVFSYAVDMHDWPGLIQLRIRPNNECGSSRAVTTSRHGNDFFSIEQDPSWFRDTTIINGPDTTIYNTETDYYRVLCSEFFGIMNSIDDQSSVPLNFSLSQNYPNPFNASTMISYSLDLPSHVKLDIYDLLGRHVTSLVDDQQSAGVHQVVWDADVVSGIYFYTISIDDKSRTMKMALLN